MGTREAGLTLRLFVAGDSPDSATAITNLRALFPPGQSCRVQMEIVDVQKDPAYAARDAILVTPTLLKVSPAPACRILGNLNNREALLAVLGIDHRRSDVT